MQIKDFGAIRQGDVYSIGEWHCTREEVIRFASQYDPQPWHLDDAAAAANPLFGKLSASGWQTLLVLNDLSDKFWRNETGVRGLAGGGIELVRWIRPLFAGETIQADMAITNVRISKSRPEMGIVEMEMSAFIDAQTPVARMKITGMFYS